MADQTQKSFPMLPVTHWWTLRSKFKQSMPGTVTINYLCSTLDMQPNSARANVLPYLKSFGLIDDGGNTGDLAKAWRDDKQYSDVCSKIRKELYPDDLIALVPTPSQDQPAVKRWFANHTGAGERAVLRMTAIYIVLSEPDLSTAPETKPTQGTERAKKKISRKTRQDPPPDYRPGTNIPGVNINLEIHISSDATPDQIDKIFESMAKHIYQK